MNRMVSANFIKGYAVGVRVFFCLLFALLLYVIYSLGDEGYQENYYTQLNIGFTHRDYLLKYPTETAVPLAVFVAFLGMIFRWKIGWMITAAYIAGLIITYIVLSFSGIANLFFVVLFVCMLIMLVQVRGYFGIKSKHMLWAGGLLLAYGGLVLLENHGGFLAKPLPPLS